MNEFDDFMTRYNVSKVEYKEESVVMFGVSSYDRSYREPLIQITLPESSLKKLIRLDKEVDEERYVINSNDTVFKAYHKYRDLLNLVRNDYKL